MPTLHGITCRIYSVTSNCIDEAPKPDSYFPEHTEDIDVASSTVTAFVEVKDGQFGIQFALLPECAVAVSGIRLVADIEVNGFKVASKEDFVDGSYYTRNNVARRTTAGTDFVDFSMCFTKILMKHCRDLEDDERIDDFGTITVYVRKKIKAVENGGTIRAFDGEFDMKRIGGVPLEALQRSNLSHTIQFCIADKEHTESLLQTVRGPTYDKDWERSSDSEEYLVKFVFKYRSAEMIVQMLGRPSDKDKGLLFGASGASTSSLQAAATLDPVARLRQLEKQSKKIADEINRTKRQKVRAENRRERKRLQRELRDRQPDYERLKQRWEDLQKDLAEAKRKFDEEKQWHSSTKRELTRLENLERKATEEDGVWDLSD